jgi:putative transposase
VHDDLVLREFTAPAPNRLWLTDITEHPTSEGTLYLCAVKDACSNRIVGYSMAERMTAQLAVDALASAVIRRRPATATVVHSDRGSQTVLNRSSQHPDRGVSNGVWEPTAAGSGVSGADPVAGTPERRVA